MSTPVAAKKDSARSMRFKTLIGLLMLAGLLNVSLLRGAVAADIIIGSGNAGDTYHQTGRAIFALAILGLAGLGFGRRKRTA